jgi:hypothetical protein
MNNNPIDKIFEEGLKDRRINPNADLWEQIERDLNANPTVGQKNTGIKIRSYLGWFAAASLLLVIGTWIKNIANSSSTVAEPFEYTTIAKKTISAPTTVDTAVSQPNDLAKMNESPLGANTVPASKNAKTANPPDKKSMVVSPVIENGSIHDTEKDLVVGRSPIKLDFDADADEVANSTSTRQKSNNSESEHKGEITKMRKLRIGDAKIVKVKTIDPKAIIEAVYAQENDEENNFFQNIQDFAKPIIVSIANRNYESDSEIKK